MATANRLPRRLEEMAAELLRSDPEWHDFLRGDHDDDASARA